MISSSSDPLSFSLGATTATTTTAAVVSRRCRPRLWSLRTADLGSNGLVGLVSERCLARAPADLATEERPFSVVSDGDNVKAAQHDGRPSQRRTRALRCRGDRGPANWPAGLTQTAGASASQIRLWPRASQARRLKRLYGHLPGVRRRYAVTRNADSCASRRSFRLPGDRTCCRLRRDLDHPRPRSSSLDETLWRRQIPRCQPRPCEGCRSRSGHVQCSPAQRTGLRGGAGMRTPASNPDQRWLNKCGLLCSRLSLLLLRSSIGTLRLAPYS